MVVKEKPGIMELRNSNDEYGSLEIQAVSKKPEVSDVGFLEIRSMSVSPLNSSVELLRN